MKSVLFLGQNEDLLNRWKQYQAQFSGEENWLVIYDTCLEDKNKINNVMTFSLCPATVDLNELQALLKQDLVTDLKSCTHLPSRTIQFLKNNSLFFSVVILIENPKDMLSLGDMCRVLQIAKIRFQKGDSELEKIRLKKLRNLIQYTHRKGCNQKLLRRMFAVACVLALILEFLTLSAHAKRVYWFPDREKEIFFSDGVILDLLYLLYCDMMAQQKNIPLVLKEYKGELHQKTYEMDSLIRYADYITGVFASVNLETGQATSEKHQILWQQAFCNNPRIMVFKMDAGCLHNTPLVFPCS